jgi:hypothetical protein
VRIFHPGQLIKVHARTRVGRAPDRPADLPAEKTTYAMRDIEHLKARAAALVDMPLPWNKMRQVYALLGLVKRWGPERVDAAVPGPSTLRRSAACRSSLACSSGPPSVGQSRRNGVARFE